MAVTLGARDDLGRGADDRRRVPRVDPRRPRDLGVRRARRGRHHAPGVPQLGPDDRAHVRRAARPGAPRRPHDADRHRRRRLHPPVLPHGRARVEDLVADRDAIAEWARISYGWMGRSPDYKAAFLGTLGANADFYEPYQENAQRWYKRGPGALPVLQPRDHQPAGRSRQGRRRGRATSSSTSSSETDDGPRRQRREGRRHRVGADPLQLHRPLRRRADQDEGLRGHLRRADGRQGREADLPPVLRLRRRASWAARSTTRSPAAWTRTTP